MKIAIYTICKNEEQHIDRWAASNKEADLRLVCDTGSIDSTVDKLRNHNVTVIPITVSPWRFDMARNTALNLLPSDIDICIWQDLDEELLPGWREELENRWEEGTTIVNHRYRHNNGPWQWHSKIHARHNCIWKGPVHETLSWSIPEKAIYVEEIKLDEHQDTSKSRKSYLTLLEKKIKEGDHNWRTYYFLANEYYGEPWKALETRITSYEVCDEGDLVKAYIANNIAKGYVTLKVNDNALKWFNISITHSNERENWYSLAEFYFKQKEWEQCYIAAKKCISISTKRDGFTYDSLAWSYYIYDYAALAAHYMGLKDIALMYGKQALELNPEDDRLKSNLEFYEQG